MTNNRQRTKKREKAAKVEAEAAAAKKADREARAAKEADDREAIKAAIELASEERIALATMAPDMQEKSLEDELERTASKINAASVDKPQVAASAGVTEKEVKADAKVTTPVTKNTASVTRAVGYERMDELEAKVDRLARAVARVEVILSGDSVDISKLIGLAMSSEASASAAEKTAAATLDACKEILECVDTEEAREARRIKAEDEARVEDYKSSLRKATASKLISMLQDRGLAGIATELVSEELSRRAAPNESVRGTKEVEVPDVSWPTGEDDNEGSASVDNISDDGKPEVVTEEEEEEMAF